MQPATTVASSIILLAAVLTASAAAAQTTPAAARRLTLKSAIDLAETKAPELETAGAGIEASKARVRAAGAQRFPKLHADANLQYWDKALDVTFSVPGMMLPAGMMAPELRVRDQLTSQVSVTLAQPLSALFVINRLIALEESGVSAARADWQRARLDAAFRATEAYLRVLQAKAQQGVVEQSLRQVEAQLERAKILESGGILQHVDVLRLTAARDNSRQAVLRAGANAQTAAEALVLALDLPTGSALETVDDLPDPPPAWTVSTTDAVSLAKTKRPEIAAARERAAQADAGEDVATSQLLPNIMAVASYQHTEGQSTFQPKNAAFIGATLSWDLWDWGKNWNGIKEAEARTKQARIGERTLHDQIAFDVRRRVLELRTTYETLAVARTALEAAEEAYRIQSVRYHEGGATTTDVLDTEIDVSRARSGYSQARYDYYLAQAGLARAVGHQPMSTIGGTNAVR